MHHPRLVLVFSFIVRHFSVRKFTHFWNWLSQIVAFSDFIDEREKWITCLNFYLNSFYPQWIIACRVRSQNTMKSQAVVRFHAVGHTYCRVKNMDAIFWSKKSRVEKNTWIGERERGSEIRHNTVWIGQGKSYYSNMLNELWKLILLDLEKFHISVVPNWWIRIPKVDDSPCISL